MDYHKIKNEEVKLCAERKISGVIAAHSIPTMFYILRKFYGQEELRNMLLHICNIFSVSPLSQTKIISALKNNAFALKNLPQKNRSQKGGGCACVTARSGYGYHVVL